MHRNKNISRIKELRDAGSHFGHLLAVDVPKQNLMDELICYETGVDNERVAAVATSTSLAIPTSNVNSNVNSNDNFNTIVIGGGDFLTEQQNNKNEDETIGYLKVCCVISGVVLALPLSKKFEHYKEKSTVGKCGYFFFIGVILATAISMFSVVLSNNISGTTVDFYRVCGFLTAGLASLYVWHYCSHKNDDEKSDDENSDSACFFFGFLFEFCMLNAEEEEDSDLMTEEEARRAAKEAEARRAAKEAEARREEATQNLIDFSDN